jgi:hypothetical protein
MEISADASDIECVFSMFTCLRGVSKECSTANSARNDHKWNDSSDHMQACFYFELAVKKKNVCNLMSSNHCSIGRVLTNSNSALYRYRACLEPTYCLQLKFNLLSSTSLTSTSGLYIYTWARLHGRMV